MHSYVLSLATSPKIIRAFLAFIASLLLMASTSLSAGAGPAANPAGQGVTLHVIVYDADQKTPLELVRVIIREGGTVTGTAVTNPAGLASIRDVQPGDYNITAHDVEYSDKTDSMHVDADHRVDSIGLHALSQEAIVVTGGREVSTSTVDLQTGTQVFESETYHAPPTSRMTNLVQENLAGAAQAPTGEVHINGQHGEYTYYVDGVPVPLGVFGGLNETVDPKVIDRATFMTGGWPAEYGGQITAIIDLQNRVPAGSFHLDANTYVGSYLVFNGTSPFSPGNQVYSGLSSSASGDSLGGRVGPFRALNSNGQSLSLSNHSGNFAYYLSGSRQETDRRIDVPTPTLYNDHGLDDFLYGKFDYIASDADYITMNLNYGRTNTEVPFDSIENGISPDNQVARNSFQTLSWYHTISNEADKESNLFAGAFARQGGLIYTVGPSDPVTFQFPGDTTDYALNENRTFSTLGTRVKYDVRLDHQWKFATGLDFSSTTGTELFTSRDSLQRPGPTVNSNYAGSEFGIFGETEWHFLEWTRIDAGVRYDQQVSPDAPLQSQVSPRFRWNFFPDQANTFYVYYGQLFMPNNLEGLGALGGNVAALPERDKFGEFAYVHVFDDGLHTKLDFFHKYATPGVDDETIGVSAVKTPVNIATVRTTGIQCVVDYSNPNTPWSGSLNTALTHAYGSGALTAGFLPVDNDGFATDLDHDQRVSITGSINYQPNDWFANLVTIFGSGLTNGNFDAEYGTGLFDFNEDAHVPSYMTFNLSGGHTFHLSGNSILEPSLYVTNLLDKDYVLKGAYFSGASIGERRNVVFNLRYHI